MNRINRLKYTGVIAGAGLAVVVFSSGVYANNGSKETQEETEAEIEVYSLDLSEDTSACSLDLEIEPASLEEDSQSEPERDAVLSAGAGDVLDNEESGLKEGAEPDTASSQEEIGLSAGVGSIFEQAGTETGDDAAQARNMETQEEVQEQTEPEKHWGYTNLGIAHVDNHLNIREEPNESGKLIGKLSKDAACEILGIDDNGWAHIKSGKVEGYVSLEFLLTGIPAKRRAEELATTMARVTTDSLKVRAEANTESEVITLVPNGEELEVADVEGDWVRVYLDDEEVFVSAEYVEVSSELGTAITMTELLYGQGVSDVRVDLCQYAKEFLGNPYVWGGTSLTKGADCSGYVLSIFKKYGVNLPHSSVAQAGSGTTIQVSEAQPGDLIFYGNGKSINHVAIYIGGGQVIHASNPKTGIRISNVSYRSPVKAVRILHD